MNKEFVDYKTALALKELGFDFEDNDILGFYSIKHGVTSHQQLTKNDGYNPAILYQQAFRWFREKYDLHGCIDLHCSTPIHWFIRIDKIDINDYLYHSEDDNIQYSTYEEAELACLKKLIEIVDGKLKLV